MNHEAGAEDPRDNCGRGVSEEETGAKKEFSVFKAEEQSEEALFFDELFSLDTVLLILSLPLVIPAVSWMWITAKRWGRILWIDWLFSGGFVLLSALIYDQVAGGGSFLFPVFMMSALSGSIYQLRKGDKLSGVAALSLMSAFALVGFLNFIGAAFFSSYGGLTGHKKRVTLVSASGDGRRLASAESDGQVYYWDLNSGEIIKQFKAAPRDVFRLGLNENGTKLLVYSNGPGLSCWNPSLGELLWKEQNLGGSMIDLKVIPGGSRAICAMSRGGLDIWDMDAGELTESLGDHGGSIACVNVSGDGQRVISGGRNDLAKVWDINDGSEALFVLEHKGDVEAVALSRSGDRALTAISGGRFFYWNLGKNKPLELKTKGTTWGLAFSKDSKRAYVLTNSNYEIWDLEGGSMLERSRFSMTKPSRTLTLTKRGRVYLGVGKTIRSYSQD